MTQNWYTWKEILDHYHAKYITTQEFGKLTTENFTGRSKQANLATKADVDDFEEKTDFDNKLKYLNKKVTSNKSKHLLSENGLDELSENVELISTEELTRDLINGCRMHKGTKYFSLSVSQNYLLFILAHIYIYIYILYIYIYILYIYIYTYIYMGVLRKY